jgi:hypothetical protein
MVILIYAHKNGDPMYIIVIYVRYVNLEGLHSGHDDCIKYFYKNGYNWLFTYELFENF